MKQKTLRQCRRFTREKLQIWLYLFALTGLAISTADAQITQLTNDPGYDGEPYWSNDGSLIVFVSDRGGVPKIWTMPPEGSAPTQITTGSTADHAPVFSPDGTTIAYFSNVGGNTDIYTVLSTGDTPVRLTTNTAVDASPCYSPDGTQIAFHSNRSGNFDIWVVPATGGTPTQLTFDTADDITPTWSPDGSRIAFSSNRVGNGDIYVIPVEGGADVRLTDDTAEENEPRWSPGGSMIAYNYGPHGSRDIRLIPAGGGQSTMVTSDPGDDGTATWSPDGRRLAFHSDRLGQYEIFVTTVALFTRVTEGPAVNDGGLSSGLSVADYDGDGLPDLLFVNQGYDTNSRYDFLYHNEGGGVFARVTGLPFTEAASDAYSASWADFDNDGDNDLVVACFKGYPSVLYINDGAGGFTVETKGSLSSDAAGSTSASWVDYDLDGRLDLFVANSSNDLEEYPPYPNYLYHNDGDSLRRVTSGEIVTVSRHTYGVAWCDYDSDGDPDLVNANSMCEESDLFRSDGAGQFSRLSASVLGTDTTNGGGASWADYDNDGDMDLFIASFWPGPSLLYENDGLGGLTKIVGHGVGMIDGRASGGVWADYDNDGDQDLYVWLDDFQVPANALGHIYENDGTGNFSQLPPEQFECDSCRSRTAAWADYDRDGDLDLFVPRANWDEPDTDNMIFRNNGNSNSCIIIKPIGVVSNRSAVGVKVRLLASILGSPVWQLRELQTQNLGQAQGPLELHFGLGDATVIDSIRLEWPSGIVQVMTDVSVDQFLTIEEACCGAFTGGYTGNTNCSTDGLRSLSDITRLIDYLYISKQPLCCPPSGNTNGSEDGSITLSDVSRLIDLIYISKQETAECG